jgi:hypothetical protein
MDCLAEKAMADAKIFTCKGCKIEEGIDMQKDSILAGPEVFNRLMDKLKERGWTVAQFIKEKGIPKSNIYNLRKVAVGKKVIKEIAAGVGVSFDWLLYGDKTPVNGDGGKEVDVVEPIDSKGIAEDKKEQVGNNLFDNKGEFTAKDTPALTFKKTSEVYELEDGKKHAVITISTEGDGRKIKDLQTRLSDGEYYLFNQQDIEFLYAATGTALGMEKE